MSMETKIAAIRDPRFLDDPYRDSDRDFERYVRIREIKVVKTQAAHMCICPIAGRPHSFPRGTIARFEKTMQDEWCSYYICGPCMENWLSVMSYAGPGGEHTVTWCKVCQNNAPMTIAQPTAPTDSTEGR